MPHEAELDDRIGHGRELEERRAQPHVGKLRADVAAELLLDLPRLTAVAELDEQVAEVGLHGHAAAGQVVARRRGAHRCRDVLHLRAAAQPPLHPLDDLLRRADAVALGQQHVGAEVGLVHLGEEVLRHAPHRPEREGEEQQRDGNRPPAVAQQRAEQTIEAAEEGPLSAARAGLRAEQQLAHERRLREGQQPAEQQRDGQHDEERLDDFGHGRRRQIERQEGDDGDERRPQQAPAGAIGTLDQRAAARNAAQHRLPGVVGHHDGVVDQHPHGDDEAGERRAVAPRPAPPSGA